MDHVRDYTHLMQALNKRDGSLAQWLSNRVQEHELVHLIATWLDPDNPAALQLAADSHQWVEKGAFQCHCLRGDRSKPCIGVKERHTIFECTRCQLRVRFFYNCETLDRAKRRDVDGRVCPGAHNS